MINKDDLVQQLLELDAEIAAAVQRQHQDSRQARIWSGGEWGCEAGNAAPNASQPIQRLRDQREILARQIETLPDFE